MLRIVVFLIAVALVATGLAWLADRPGLIVFNWEGYEGEISVFHAVVALTFLIGLAILLWSLARAVWTSPATVGNYFYRRRQKRGLDALSSGIIAIGAGDRTNAMRYAIQARKTLPNEPLTHLLRAQAAQLSGDSATTRRIFEAMLAQPDTEQLGLRGLFLEAQREGELEAARQFADRALALNPKLGWSTDALFELQCKAADWDSALQTLASAKKHGHIEKAVADRRRAVLLTAQAQKLEDADPQRAMGLALEAHGLAPNLIPAAAIAGRLLAARGNTPKAAKVLQKTWLNAPHPDLAVAYAFARLGDSPRDRLDRVRQLAAVQQHSIESPIAVARAAIEAREFAIARQALEPLMEDRLTQRVATLMARIEAEEHGNKGRVREWLARAAHAARDPAWTADGIVSETWAPISPATGQLDAFQWRVPAEALESTDAGLLAEKLEELAAIGAPLDAIDSRPIEAAPAAAKPVIATVETKAAQPPAPAVAAPPKAAPSPGTTATEVPQSPDVKPPAEVTSIAATAASDLAQAPAKAPGTPTALTVAPVSPMRASDERAPVTPVRAEPAPLAPQTVAVAAEPAEKRLALPARTAPDRTAANGAATARPSAKGEPPAAEQPTPVAAPNPPTAKPAAKARVDEPKIFISPRAPDDPGPGTAEVEELKPIPRYGTTR